MIIRKAAEVILKHLVRENEVAVVNVAMVVGIVQEETGVMMTILNQTRGLEIDGEDNHADHLMMRYLHNRNLIQ